MHSWDFEASTHNGQWLKKVVFVFYVRKVWNVNGGISFVTELGLVYIVAIPLKLEISKSFHRYVLLCCKIHTKMRKKSCIFGVEHPKTVKILWFSGVFLSICRCYKNSNVPIFKLSLSDHSDIDGNTYFSSGIFCHVSVPNVVLLNFF